MKGWKEEAKEAECRSSGLEDKSEPQNGIGDEGDHVVGSRNSSMEGGAESEESGFSGKREEDGEREDGHVRAAGQCRLLRVLAVDQAAALFTHR